MVAQPSRALAQGRLRPCVVDSPRLALNQAKVRPASHRQGERGKFVLPPSTGAVPRPGGRGPGPCAHERRRASCRRKDPVPGPLTRATWPLRPGRQWPPVHRPPPPPVVRRGPVPGPAYQAGPGACASLPASKPPGAPRWPWPRLSRVAYRVPRPGTRLLLGLGPATRRPGRCPPAAAGHRLPIW